MIGPALLLAAQAATPAPAQTGPTVVVEGRRADRVTAARRLAVKIAPYQSGRDPLPRFTDPICPAADGLPGPVAAAFAARVRTDAAQAHIPVAGAGCTPNIIVLFPPDGREAVRALRRARPGLFAALAPDRTRRLTDEPGPVRAWSYTQLRSRDGDEERLATLTHLPAPELYVRDASILKTTTRMDVDGAVVVIDQPAAIGKTINQLADYVAMRTMAQAKPVDADGGEPTILRLFDPDTQPTAGLTAFDQAYLRAFYVGPPTEAAVTRVHAIAHRVGRGIATPAAP